MDKKKYQFGMNPINDISSYAHLVGPVGLGLGLGLGLGFFLAIYFSL